MSKNASNLPDYMVFNSQVKQLIKVKEKKNKIVYIVLNVYTSNTLWYYNLTVLTPLRGTPKIDIYRSVRT